MSELNDSPLEQVSNPDGQTPARTPLSMVLIPLLLIFALIVWYRFN